MDARVLAQALTAAAKVLTAGLTEVEVRETKVAPKVTKKAAPVVEVDNEDLPVDGEESEETESGPTSEDVMLAFKKYVKGFGDVKKGRLEAQKVLKKLKAETISEIDEADYAKALKLLK